MAFDASLIANIGQRDVVGDTIQKAYSLKNLLNEEQVGKLSVQKMTQDYQDAKKTKDILSKHDVSTPQGMRQAAEDLSKNGLSTQSMDLMSHASQVESGDLQLQIQRAEVAQQQQASIVGYIDPIVNEARQRLSNGQSPALVDAWVQAQTPKLLQDIQSDRTLDDSQKQQALQAVQQGPLTYNRMFEFEARSKQGQDLIKTHLDDLKAQTEGKKEATLEKIAAQGGKPPAGYEWDPANPGSLIPIKGGPKDPAAGGALDDDTIQDLATQYNLTGKMPPMGRGDSASVDRHKILNAAAKQLKDAGQNEQSAIVAQAALKAGQSAYATLKKSQEMVGNYEKTALANMQIVRDTSAKVDRTGSPVMNRWLLAGKKSITGDPNVTAFDTAINTLAEEYAKVMSGATGSTAATDSARTQAHDMINKAQNPEQLKAALDIMQKEMANRMASYDDQLKELQSDMGLNVGQKPTAAPAATTKPASIDDLMKKYGGG